MPEKFYKYSAPEQDGRYKILPSQHKNVREVYALLHSERKTAKVFNCSRRCISYILHPEKYKAALKQRKENKVHLLYYNRNEHTQAISKYRKKKRILGFRQIISNTKSHA